VMKGVVKVVMKGVVKVVMKGVVTVVMKGVMKGGMKEGALMKGERHRKRVYFDGCHRNSRELTGIGLC